MVVTGSNPVKRTHSLDWAATYTPSIGTGKVQVTVVWDNNHDLDLWVTEPSGHRIWYSQPHRRAAGP